MMTSVENRFNFPDTTDESIGTTVFFDQVKSRSSVITIG